VLGPVTHCWCVGLARTIYIYIYGVYTVFLTGKSPNIRSYTVYLYGSSQPYWCDLIMCFTSDFESWHRGTYFSCAESCDTLLVCRVGQSHIHTVCIRYSWQGNFQIYGQIQCIYMVLANPIDVTWQCASRATLGVGTEVLTFHDRMRPVPCSRLWPAQNYASRSRTICKQESHNIMQAGVAQYYASRSRTICKQESHDMQAGVAQYASRSRIICKQESLTFSLKKKRKESLRRQWKPLPTLNKEKEPLWYRVP